MYKNISSWKERFC